MPMICSRADMHRYGFHRDRLQRAQIQSCDRPSDRYVRTVKEVKDNDTANKNSLLTNNNLCSSPQLGE